MNIKTPRLNIRKPEKRDVIPYGKIRNSDFVLKYNPMSKRNEEEIEDEFNGDENILIIESPDSILIGAIFYHDDTVRFWDKAVEISFFLGEEFVRQGYMTEALRAVVAMLFTEKDFHLVSARAFAENTASTSLIKKLGFKEDGYIRKGVMCQGILYDDVLFSQTREEWK